MGFDDSLKCFVDLVHAPTITATQSTADIQGKLPESLRQLERQFSTSVSLHVYDGPIDRRVRTEGWRAISILDKEGSRDDIYKRLESHLERLKETGRIGEDAYRQARGIHSGRDAEVAGRRPGGSEPDGPRPRVSERDRDQSQKHGPESGAGARPLDTSKAAELGNRFRRSTQAERIADPTLNPAAKVLANANGVIDAAFGRDSKQAAELRAAVSERIAQKLDQGVSFTVPRTLQRAREPDIAKGRDRANPGSRD